jgi:hypothetical protein
MYNLYIISLGLLFKLYTFPVLEDVKHPFIHGTQKARSFFTSWAIISLSQGLCSMELVNETYDNTYTTEVYYIKISQKRETKIARKI